MTTTRERPSTTGHDLAGTGALLRLYLRRDRISMPLWVALFAIAPPLYVASVQSLYTSDAELARFAAATNASHAEIAMYGPMFGTSLGSVGLWKAGAYFTLIAIATILTVVRHTRAEEETGRAELIGSTVVGRYAGLTAALLMAFGASILTGFLCTAALLGKGLPLGGSAGYGAALALSGAVFAAIAAVAAQLSASARISRGIAFAVLGTAFALRAVGDAGSGTLSWFSPLGWALQMRPFAAERWWVVVPLLATTAGATTLAYALARRRDIGAGLIEPRPGPSEAPPALAGPLGLAWRMQRGTLLAWTVGLGLYGLLIGSAAKGVGDQLGDNAAIRDLVVRMGGSQSLELSFIGYAMSLLGVAGAAYAISAALRLHSEEDAQRTEPVLAGSVGRMRWAAGHIVFSLAGPIVAMTVAGVSAALTYTVAVGDGSVLGKVLGAALVQLPAIWVLTGVTVALFGMAPRFAPVAWGVLAAFLAVLFIGPIAHLPQWVLDLEPFGHAPKLPGSEFTATPVLWLTTVAAALIVAGLFAFRQRDLR
ncbi:ABC transporter permease [Rhodococcus sp. NPDC003382]